MELEGLLNFGDIVYYGSPGDYTQTLSGQRYFGRGDNGSSQVTTRYISYTTIWNTIDSKKLNNQHIKATIPILECCPYMMSFEPLSLSKLPLHPTQRVKRIKKQTKKLARTRYVPFRRK